MLILNAGPSLFKICFMSLCEDSTYCYSHTRIPVEPSRAPDVPGSYGVDHINRDVPERDSDILSEPKLPGSAGVHPVVLSNRLCRAGTMLSPGSAMFTPGSTVLTPGSTVLTQGSTVLAVDLVMDLVDTTIFLPEILGGIFSSFRFFSAFSSMLTLQRSS